MPEVSAPDGTPVNAVVGFLNFVARLLTDRRPKRMVVAFEFGEAWRPEFRVKLIPEYKSHRVAAGGCASGSGSARRSTSSPRR